jgi:hypothetical protein
MRNAGMAIQTEGRRLALRASRRPQLLLWLVGWITVLYSVAVSFPWVCVAVVSKICWDWIPHLCCCYQDAFLFRWLLWWGDPSSRFWWRGIWCPVVWWWGPDWNYVQQLLIYRVEPIWCVSRFILFYILESFRSSGTKFISQKTSSTTSPRKTQTLPDIIKFIFVKYRDESWQTARGLVLLRQH